MPTLEVYSRRLLRALCTLTFVALIGCAGDGLRPPLGKPAEPGPGAALSYYQALQRMTLAELSRERSILTAVPQTPFTQLRMAMLLGSGRIAPDLPKAQQILDSLLKSIEPSAATFQPIARVLADNYAERLKLEAQVERQSQLAKEAQRRQQELQEKLDGLAGIERSLTVRPRQQRLPPGKGEGR